MDYIDRLTELRIDRDVGQKEIATVLDCQQAAVSKYENRRANYSINDLILLCQYYHISADYILGLPKNMPYPEK